LNGSAIQSPKPANDCWLNESHWPAALTSP
jgi:hypothetical protein